MVLGPRTNRYNSGIHCCQHNFGAVFAQTQTCLRKHALEVVQSTLPLSPMLLLLSSSDIFFLLCPTPLRRMGQQRRAVRRPVQQAESKMAELLGPRVYVRFYLRFSRGKR